MRRTCTALLALLLVAGAMAESELKVQTGERKITLNTQFVRIVESLKIKNTGDKEVQSVMACILQSPGAVISFFKAGEVVADSKTVTELKMEPVKAPADAPANVRCFSVLRKIAAGETATIGMSYTIANAQTPFPEEITQQESHLLLYHDNIFITSPYTVSTQTTDVSTSGTIKSYTDSPVKAATKQDKNIKYGKFDLIKPWTVTEMRVHAENQRPFKKAVTYVKEIEVSHWGNIYVEESYVLKNAGARHVGPFSRLKYAHSYNGKANSFQTIHAVLPPGAHSMYYVDLIGNISTSAVKQSIKDTVIEFDLRYPLMGGWKTDFKIGYSVPLTGFLFQKRSDGKRRLTMELATPLEDVFVEDMVVKVVLPEGSYDIKSVLPYDVEQSFEKKFTYLDTSGRPVLVLHKTNMVPEHAAKFSVDYRFSTTSMLHEPFLLITFYFCLLVAVIVYNRMELTISRDDKWQEARSREVLATFMEQIQSLIEDEMAIMSGLSKAASSIRDASDVDSAARDRTFVDKRLKEIDEKMKPLLAAVEVRSVRVVGQVREVLDKVRGLQGKYAKLLADRVDLVKKGTGMTELTRKLAPSQSAINESKREVEAAIEGLFGAY